MFPAEKQQYCDSQQRNHSGWCDPLPQSQPVTSSSRTFDSKHAEFDA
jgi:hypothetical protein